jgi:hypothetical protein
MKTMNEEFVENFTSDGELTPIDIVAEITGLTYDEIRSCSKIVRVPATASVWNATTEERTAGADVPNQ